MTSPDQGNSDTLQSDMPTICPPALRCLVFLWEQICTNCVQVIQRNGMNADNDANIKESTLIDAQNIEDFDIRKSEGKKGLFFFFFRQNKNILFPKLMNNSHFDW